MIETGADPERAIRQADKEAEEEEIKFLHVSQVVQRMARAAHSSTLRRIVSAYNRKQQE